MSRRTGKALASKKARNLMLAITKGRCVYCGVKITVERIDPLTQLQPDHIVAHHCGGSDAPSNLVAACASCNASKRDNQLVCEDGGPAWWLPTRLMDLGLADSWPQARRIAASRIAKAFAAGPRLAAAMSARGLTR